MKKAIRSNFSSCNKQNKPNTHLHKNHSVNNNLCILLKTELSQGKLLLKLEGENSHT